MTRSPVILSREDGEESGRRKPRALATFAFAFFIAVSASAQLASDIVPRERTVPRGEEIRKSLEDSRYHLGAIRVRPIFGLRDLGYDNNVFGTNTDQAVGDWRTTVSAGADLILPMGSKMYLTGTVNPEYTYYQKLTDRRLLGGEYGGSAVALFNRLSIEAGASTDKSIAPVSSELELSTPGRRNDAFARSEIEIFRRLSLFGSAQRQEQRYSVTASDAAAGINLDQLERNETFFRGGARYWLRSYLDMSVAYESGRTDFVSAQQSNNSTRAVLLGIHYDRPRFFLNLSGGSRSGEARGPLSTFPNYSTPTGSYYAAYRLGAPIVVEAFGHRSTVYGIYTSNPYYIETINSVGLTVPIGQRIGLRAFGGVGTNAYPVLSVDAVKRTDDVRIAAFGVAYRLYRNVVLSVIASDWKYNSNIDTYDRSVFRLATSLSFRGESFQ